MRRLLHWGVRFGLWLALLFCAVLLLLSGTGISQYGSGFQKSSAFFVTILMTAGMLLAFAWIAWLPSFGRSRTSVGLYLGIIAMQVFFLTMVSRPMSIADPARVQNEAMEMLRHRQGQMNPDNLYLQSYPNNHFLIVLFYYYYLMLEFMGITKVWIPTIVLNVCCIDLGIYLTCAAARKIKGDVAANLVLLLFLLCPTTYLWLTSAYTNTISFPFLAGILYLGADGERASTRGRAVARIILLGILMVVGFFVRPTTAISVIALILYRFAGCFQKNQGAAYEKNGGSFDWKESLGKPAVKCLLLFCAVGVTWLGCRGLIGRHVDGDKFTGNFPVVHWVMMGMNEESGGGFSREDRIYTGSFPELEDKRRADVERLKQRLHSMGISGVGKQFVSKLTRVWALGDDDGIPNAKYAYNFPPLFSYVIGKDNAWFIFYMQAFRTGMFFLMSWALLGQLRKRECTSVFLYALTFLGAVCFFLLWEAGKRYNICFNGVCLLLMSVGVCELRQWMARGAERVVRAAPGRERLIKGVAMGGVPVAVLCLLATCLILGKDCRKSQAVDKSLSFCSKMGTDAESINCKGIRRADLLEQTIGMGQMGQGGRWNRIKIFFANSKPSERVAEYRIELISLEDNQVIYSKEIAPCQIKPDGGFVIRPKQEKLSPVGYKLRLTHLGKPCNLIPMVCKFPLLNPYPYGSLAVNGRETDWDLSMCIYHIPN